MQLLKDINSSIHKQLVMDYINYVYQICMLLFFFFFKVFNICFDHKTFLKKKNKQTQNIGNRTICI